MTVKQDTMEYDVVIVGAGPAGLSAACKLKQLAGAANIEISVCVVEKGSEVGAHILSGAILEPRALHELFPDWQLLGAPVNTPVLRDDFYFFRNGNSAVKWPNAFLPKSMYNKDNYVISLGTFCRWLGEQAETLGVEIYPGFAAQHAIIENDKVQGIVTGDHGVARSGKPKEGIYSPGVELRAEYTLFAEGSRGHIGKNLQEHFQLRKNVDSQHYAIGLKELWEIDSSKSEAGLVMHSFGWPLSSSSHGGGFLYHLEANLLAVGFIVDLSYSNPFLSPFDEFQRFKHHPVIRQYLDGGKRICYGARSISKGSYNSLPKMAFPGGALIGCELGTLNFAKIKGIHTAMKSGMLAAEAIAEHMVKSIDGGKTLTDYPERFKASWLHKELYQSRNFGPAIQKFGFFLGVVFNFFDQNILNGRSPFTLHDNCPDHMCLTKATEARNMNYPKSDGKLSFDRLSSVYLSNIKHIEDQPVHLTLKDPDIPITENLPLFDEPAQRYCPAGVYEVIPMEDGTKNFQINAQNCVHCKVCDIKDPAQNIIWIAPEGSSGPNYSNM